MALRVPQGAKMEKINIGIIGYGSMGKMLFEKYADNDTDFFWDVFVANRTKEKLSDVAEEFICGSNFTLAEKSDIIFICVRPSDLKNVLEEIKPAVSSEKIVISLNGSVSFESINKILKCKTAKVIPSVTAEINRSQTLVCFNSLCSQKDKETLKGVLKRIGDVIELPENEMGMGSELVSCMPGFIASIFDVLYNSAKKHTAIPENQIVEMLLKTLSATSSLMLNNKMTLEDVVKRVATKGGITEEGTAVIYNGFPSIADELFDKTLEKRRLTWEAFNRSFSEFSEDFMADGRKQPVNPQ